MYELPALVRNPKVTSINGIPRSALESYLEENGWSEKAFVRVCKDIEDGLLKNQPFNPNSPPAVPSSEAGGGAKLSVDSIRQNPKSSLGNVATTKASKAVARTLGTDENDSVRLFKQHGTLPGGIVATEDIKLRYNFQKVAIDPNSEGDLILDDRSTFSTGLSYEEICTLLMAAYSEDSGFGAQSTHHTSGVFSCGVVGGILRLADVCLGEYVLDGTRDPLLFPQNLSRLSATTDLCTAILKVDEKRIQTELEVLFRRVNHSVVLEFTEIELSRSIFGSLSIGYVDTKVHLFAFNQSALQPIVLGELNHGIDSTSLFRERANKLLVNGGLELKSNPILSRTIMYMAVYAMFREARTAKKEIIGNVSAVQMWKGRSVFNLAADTKPIHFGKRKKST